MSQPWGNLPMRIKSVIDGKFIPTVVVDTREQAPYSFEGIFADKADGGEELKVDITRRTLASGDYSLAGLEGRLAVERKSLADLFGTLGKGRERFERELDRLQAMECAAVVVESGWQELIENPPTHSEMQPKTVLRSIIAFQQKYDRVHWNFMGSRRLAEVTTFRIMERFWKESQRKTVSVPA